ncbi:hypothetical protein DFH08DRAFT_1087779 [Mycena albidolilacea]|uniref:Uncharacterized protein n=1 Tax=Mycena albidolilacea TaxID=1033008 RepID=A0AAD6Z8H8_9AGAR|nr:hypothetical protein DFH08DRAFT_1087779 [Mycena albidolilacea]
MAWDTTEPVSALAGSTLYFLTLSPVGPRTSEELLKHLRSAKIDARLCTLESAPHFGNATHPNETNTLLYDFVIANCVAADLPPAPAGVGSLFLAELAAFGLLDDDSENED